MTLHNMLKNPIYAGVYAYGKRQVDPRKKRPGRASTGRVTIDSGHWHAFIEESFPAYISLQQYEQNVERLAANRARAEQRGAVRHGPSLLQGLLICGKCAHRMQVRYGGPKAIHTYTCSRLATDYAESFCHYLPGAPVDEFVGEWVLKALQPAALELSLEASEHLEKEREELDGLWQKRLERASYEADRAGRHYRLIEPENRLAARQLAREWEEMLEAQRKVQEDYRRFLREQPRSLSALEREDIRRLAQDIPALWHSSSTTTAERKEIVRQIIERVIVENEGKSERLQVSIEWVGGSKKTKGVVIRPVRKMEYLSYYPRLCERIRELLAQELSIAEIAETLNREGMRPPKQTGRLGRQSPRCSSGLGYARSAVEAHAILVREVPQRMSGGLRIWPESSGCLVERFMAGYGGAGWRPASRSPRGAGSSGQMSKRRKGSGNCGLCRWATMTTTAG